VSDHGLPTTRNKVQELQRTLYRAAKADPKMVSSPRSRIGHGGEGCMLSGERHR
jgi:hypothetical protein